MMIKKVKIIIKKKEKLKKKMKKKKQLLSEKKPIKIIFHSSMIYHMNITKKKRQKILKRKIMKNLLQLI